MFKLNCKKAPQDVRDAKTTRHFKFKATSLPTEHVLPIQLPVYMQGAIGSCTGNAGSLCYRWESFEKLKSFAFEPSRLFLYYNTRKLEGTINEDAGAYIRTTFKAMNKFGISSEAKWPYIESKFADEPTNEAYSDALSNLVVKYSSVDQDVRSIKEVIYSGACVAFGFIVYESFMQDDWHKHGIMPLPKKDEDEMGGHAISAIGWSDSKQAFLIQNSWGNDWCVDGKFWMPYSFITNKNYAFDFWCIDEIQTRTEDPKQVIDAIKVLFTPASLYDLPKSHINDFAALLGLRLTPSLFRSKMAKELVEFVFGKGKLSEGLDDD